MLLCQHRRERNLYTVWCYCVGLEERKISTVSVMLLCQPRRDRNLYRECHATVSAWKREKCLHRAWWYCVNLEERERERDNYVWSYCVSLQDIEILQRVHVWCYCVILLEILIEIFKIYWLHSIKITQYCKLYNVRYLIPWASLEFGLGHTWSLKHKYLWNYPLPLQSAYLASCVPLLFIWL